MVKMESCELSENYNQDLEWRRWNTTSYSMYDLMMYDEVKEAVKKGDVKAFEKCLHKVGVDLKKGYCFAERLHRPIHRDSNTPVMGTIVIFEERTDEEWIKSGLASFDAEVRAKGDTSLEKEVESMSRWMEYGKVYEGGL